jgi:hypothetical protein
MSIERLVVGGVTTALFVFATCYAVWRHAAVGSVDWAGVIVLGLGGAVCATMVRYLPAVASVVEAGSENESGEDRPHSGLDSAGFWPIAVAATATATGLVHQALWVIVPGVAAVVLTTGGLVFRQPGVPTAHRHPCVLNPPSCDGHSGRYGPACTRPRAESPGRGLAVPAGSEWLPPASGLSARAG